MRENGEGREMREPGQDNVSIPPLLLPPSFSLQRISPSPPDFISDDWGVRGERRDER